MDAALTTRHWSVKPFDHDKVWALAKSLGLDLWQAQVLSHRGLDNAQNARSFLSSKLDDLPPPLGMLGVDAAVDLLLAAIMDKKTIAVAGDYDVDGVTATALLVDFLRQLEATVIWYLPHRLDDGYGFSPAAARHFFTSKADLIVTVDCGISDYQGVEEAKRLGMKVIVTDHHKLPPGPLVAADAIINPHQSECAFSPHLTGVGLAFYLAAALRARLRQTGFFKSAAEPILRQSLDLVALGTCADVAPMVAENRILVNAGLRVINESPRLGLAELLRLIRAGGHGPNEVLDARDLSFMIIPRLNAAGRLDHPAVALELLLCQDQAQACKLAAQLDQLNATRRQLEEETLNQARQLWASTPESQKGRCLVLVSRNWHRGVLGIVANRMADITGRPCLMLAVEGDYALGSGRSVKGVDLQQALISQSHLLERCGGHSMAVGLSLKLDKLQQFRAAINDYLSALPLPAAELRLDAEVELSQLNGQIMGYLKNLAPFGAGNPEPCLLLRRVKMSAYNAMMSKSRHLRLVMHQGGIKANAIAFGRAERQWPQLNTLYDVACTPRVSNYGAAHLELVVEDWRQAN